MLVDMAAQHLDSPLPAAVLEQAVSIDQVQPHAMQLNFDQSTGVHAARRESSASHRHRAIPSMRSHKHKLTSSLGPLLDSD